MAVTIANRFWPRIGIESDQQWVDLIAAAHGTDVASLDYVNEPEPGREFVNDWVSDRTAGLFPDRFSKRSSSRKQVR